ncbi:MAG: dienelactone hydrolase [Gammaproteobacteria bacterium RIFCSPHIGHO2_12_FULL_63_22]|nr:MAG: dienelactone hydrolase [Gammaproteobacteria bacterium RIFCSPHIGHO2_12_FULL_63_22]
MRALIVLLLFAASFNAAAAPRADKISWTDGGKTFDGYLVWDDSSKALRPGLVMVPNWYGVNDSNLAKAKTLAGKDYVILLADVYGRGLRPANADEAGKASGAAASDPAALRSHVQAALAALRKSTGKAPVDAGRIGAIGFCFGGMVALELARSGADLAGVATFHANLSTSMPAKAGVLKSPVLSMNGANDSFVSAASISGFEKEMRDAKADWQFVNFGGAVHCFAEPDEHGTVPGCEYHAPSYRRSVALMKSFFGEVFARR